MKILEESKSHYVLQAPNGAKIKVAKNGLSTATSQKIQGMAKGGKVEYGTSTENTLNTQAVDAFKKAFSGESPQQAPKPEPKKVAQYAYGTPEGGIPEEDDGSTDTEPTPGAIHIDMSGAQAQHDPKAMFSALETAFQKGQESGASQAQAQGQVVPASMTEPAVDTTRAPAGGLNSGLHSGAPTQGGNAPDFFKQISVVQNGQSPEGTQAVDDYLKSNKDAISQIDNEDKANQKAYETSYGEHSEFAQNLKRYDDDFNQVRGNMDILRGKLEKFELKPKNMFSGGNTLQNIGTALAVLAGGISQGLTKSATNPVMDYINNQIDLDLQRQKHDYGKLENQYTLLREQGHSDLEASHLLRAEQLQTINTMLHMNEQKTKNVHTKMELQKAGAAILLQRDEAIKGAVTQKLVRANLEKQAGQSPQGGMMNVSDHDTDLREKKRVENVGKQFETISKSIPYLGLQPKAQEEAIKEVQRLGEAHRNVQGLMEDFKNLIKTKGDFKNLIRRNPYASSIMVNAIPFMKTVEGKPQEFEGKALEHLLSGWLNSKEDAEVQINSFRKWLQNGSESSVLQMHQIPYPKLRLGGKSSE